MIDLKEYSKFNDSVDKYPESMKPVIYILGLIGEVGEYCNKYKKIFRDQGGQMKKRDKNIGYELGDIGWYFERLVKSQGFELEEIFKMNQEKLQIRKDNDTIGGSGDHR